MGTTYQKETTCTYNGMRIQIDKLLDIHSVYNALCKLIKM